MVMLACYMTSLDRCIEEKVDPLRYIDAHIRMCLFGLLHEKSALRSPPEVVGGACGPAGNS
jgi:hypothetical protein